VLVLLVGASALLGTFGGRRGIGSADLSDQRAVEREAQRQANALASEIARRERVLAELRRQSR
jgi:hypothetical protein